MFINLFLIKTQIFEKSINTLFSKVKGYEQQKNVLLHLKEHEKISRYASVYYSINILTQLMASHIVLNQQFIFCTFLRITSEPDEIE